MVGKLDLSILNKKHTFGHIQVAKVISAQRLTSKTRIFSIFPWQWAIFISCKLNLDIKFPPPYERLVWDYDKADAEKIEKYNEEVHWENTFNHKNPHQQVANFNKTIINISSNFVSNRLITCDDGDRPWMNESVKNQIKWKNKIYKDYVKNGRTENELQLNFKLQ